MSLTSVLLHSSLMSTAQLKTWADSHCTVKTGAAATHQVCLHECGGVVPSPLLEYSSCHALLSKIYLIVSLHAL